MAELQLRRRRNKELQDLEPLSNIEHPKAINYEILTPLYVSTRNAFVSDFMSEQKSISRYDNYECKNMDRQF